jgi:hypothetical protein
MQNLAKKITPRTAIQFLCIMSINTFADQQSQPAQHVYTHFIFITSEYIDKTAVNESQTLQFTLNTDHNDEILLVSG